MAFLTTNYIFIHTLNYTEIAASDCISLNVNVIQYVFEYFVIFLKVSLSFPPLAVALPQVWHMENVARLLVLCGTTLCYNVLANKAQNGRLFELSRLLVYLTMVRMSSLILN